MLNKMADEDKEVNGSLAMQRFLDTPFEEYPVDLITIRNAARKISLNDQISSRPTRYEPYPRRRSYTGSIGSNCSSAGSDSAPSFYSYDGRPSRKGRRKVAFDWDAFKSPSPPEDKLFYCTFCPKSFSGRYEWNRHEEAVHIPQRLWVCNADENDRLATSGSCPYCDKMNPTFQHLEDHKHSQCKDRPESDRTFLRKDHLTQHLLSFHGCTKKAHALATIESCQQVAEPLEPSHPSLHCGFCGYHSFSWEERVEHIASHFKMKIDLLEWWLQRKNHFQNPLASDMFVISICLIDLLLTRFT